MVVNRIWSNGKNLLRKQRGSAKRMKGRQNYKEHHGGKSADYRHIYTDNSLKAHLIALRKFADYCELKDVRRFKDVDYDVVGGFALYLQNELGLSAWTVKNYLMTINHLLIGAGLRAEDDAFSAQKWNKNHRGSHRIKSKMRKDIQHNRSMTAQAWRDQHKQQYLNNRALIDTERAFGLRQAEVDKIDDAKPSIIAPCFFKNNDDLYCLVVRGKGGRPRLATCRQDMRDEMLKLYGFQNLKYVPQNMEQLKHFTNSFMAQHASMYRRNEYLYQTNIHDLPNHINRREYAQERLRELDRNMQGKGKQRTINGVKDYENRFIRLAQDLGHNRIGILGNYLGK